jgi:hypothetical protein
LDYWFQSGSSARIRYRTKKSQDLRTALTLEGEYDAPFGAAGAVFDAVLGRRIASVTAKALLKNRRFLASDKNRKRCMPGHGLDRSTAVTVVLNSTSAEFSRLRIYSGFRLRAR